MAHRRSRSSPPAPVKLRRLRAGFYETLDGQWRIIRNAGVYTGPHGGRYDPWEIARRDRFGEYAIIGALPSPTKRAAVAELRQLIAAQDTDA